MFDGLPLPLSDENMFLLLQLEHVFEQLILVRLPDDCILLPFSANVNSMEYSMEVQFLSRHHHQPGQFHSIDISPKQVSVTFILDGVNHWDGLIISFLNRLAAFNHLEQLDLALHYFDERYLQHLEFEEPNAPSTMVDALIRVLYGHPHLTQLNIIGMHWICDWQPHIQRIFRALEDHPGIRILVLKTAPLEDDSDEEEDTNNDGIRDSSESSSRHPVFSWLKQLLTRNRNIVVSD